MDATAAAGPPKSQPRTAVVVGGGPAGCLLALLLVQQGWKVHVMEMRDRDSAVGSQSKLRSWAIAVYSRGINAILKAVPGAGDFFRSRTYQALVLHDKDGNIKGVLDRKQSGAALVHRSEVAGLLTTAIEQHSDTASISMHYGACLTVVDFGSKVATFKVAAPAAAAGKLELAYELLVGADGAMSAVRAALIQAFPSRIRLIMLCPSDGRVYKAFHGMPQDPQALPWDPAGHGGTPAEAAAAIAAGHWPAAGRPSDPGICFNVFHLPPPAFALCTSYDIDKGTYSGYIAMSDQSLPAPLDSEEAWSSWMDERAFSPLPHSWRKQLVAQLAQGPINRISNVQRASTFTLSGTGSVLIGDAAHTVTPALGQGINSALEDAVLLADALRSCGGGGSGGGVETALGRFSRARLPQIEAMQVLEMSMRTASVPLYEGTWLGDLIARLRRTSQGKAAGGPNTFRMFGNTNTTMWQRVRIAVYWQTKVRVAASLGFILGRRRADAWLPWLLKGPPMIEVQMGQVDYVTMIRLMNAYVLVVGGGAAVATLALGRALLLRTSQGRSP